MKLSKNCKLLLDTIILLKPDVAALYYTTYYVAQHADLGISYNEYKGLLNTLAETHAIEWGDKQHTTFMLNEKGRAYKELDRLEAKDRWVERIVGFVVGFLTSSLSGLFLWFVTK